MSFVVVVPLPLVLFVPLVLGPLALLVPLVPLELAPLIPRVPLVPLELTLEVEVGGLR
jgi:hypothetical protein